MANGDQNRNPIRFPQDLSAAEKRFVENVALGKPLALGANVPLEGTEDNTIRGELISFLVRGDDGQYPVKWDSIFLRGAWIPDGLGLERCDPRLALIFLDCNFVETVCMPYIHCQQLIFQNSVLQKGFLGRGMQVTGSVDFSGSKFGQDREGYAVTLHFSKIGWHLLMEDGFSANGVVELNSTKIGGNWSCSRSTLQTPDSETAVINAAGVQVGGHVHMNNGFHAKGCVFLARAEISGDWDCSKGIFQSTNAKKLAIDASGMQARANVFMGDGFHAKGQVVLLRATIAGSLNCDDGTFQNPSDGDAAISAENMQIKEAFSFRKVRKVEGAINLGYASATIWVDNADRVKDTQFVLDGFTYAHFHEAGDYESRIKWLNNRPDGIPFSPQPYEQAAKVLFAMGRGHTARKILLAKEKQLIKYGLWSDRIYRKIWYGLLDCVYGLGKTISFSLAAIIIGWLVFGTADYRGYIVPHHAPILANCDYRMLVSGKTEIGEECKYTKRKPREKQSPTEAVATLFPDYPEFNSFWYSVDVFFPFFAMHQEPFWYPQDPDGEANWFTVWYWLQIVAGWILTSIFLLSITDRLRSK